MSRLRFFVQGVASTYLSLAASILYSLVSVPLALHFLSKEEFGLWALLTQVFAYLMLVDFGMSPSASRLLIEHKDRPNDGAYGRLLQTGFLVAVVQGVLVLAVGLILAPGLATLFHIPAHLHDAFCTLVRWQAVIVAFVFATRLLRSVLYAHLRLDLVNYALALSLVVGLVTLGLALQWQVGVQSVLWSAAVGQVAVAVVCWWQCHRLRLFPVRGAWGRPAWSEFKALFGYGKDVFIVQMGAMLIMASQPIIISRSLGLEAVAAWSVGTKAFNLLGSLFWQGFDASTSAFSEMLVRGEQERLRQRFTGMVVVMQVLCGVLAVVYATCNSLFVAVWTHGRILWPVGNDVMLGVWLLLAVLIHANGGLIVLTKRIEGMRYVLVAEGLVFVLLASAVVPHGGIPAMVAVSLLCGLCFSGAYGIWRVNRFFQLRFPELERWWLGLLGRIGMFLLPVAAVTWWATSALNNLSRLGLNAVIVGGLGGYLFLRHGIPHELQAEILQRTPPALRGRLEKLIRHGSTSP